MIWIVLIGILSFVGIKFFTALTKDNDDLQNQTLAQKFSVIVNIINQATFNGEGKITSLNKREFNLYKEDENQIIKFYYSTGNLTITWKYKYFQKEVVHDKQLDNVRNLSIFDQERIANNLVTEMVTIVGNHKQEVIKPAITPANTLIISAYSQSFRSKFIDSLIMNAEGINGIIINQSNTEDVIRIFGPAFTTRELGQFANEIIYSDLGLSFFYRPDNTLKTIFIITAKYPFTGRTNNNIKIEVSTFQDLVDTYGHPTELIPMDSYFNYKVDGLYFGFSFDLTDFKGFQEEFEYEKQMRVKLKRVKLIGLKEN